MEVLNEAPSIHPHACHWIVDGCVSLATVSPPASALFLMALMMQAWQQHSYSSQRVNSGNNPHTGVSGLTDMTISC